MAKDIEDFSNALTRLKEQMDKIKSMVSDQLDTGNEYTMKHIQKFDANHRMVGTKGIRLKVRDENVINNDLCTCNLYLSHGSRSS